MSIKKDHKRNIIQLAAAVFFNGYALGYKQGKIFKGSSKAICVPVLNCYSCPGALGACPVGSLQSLISGRHFKISFYVLGYIMLFGILLGRGICGFLCPFGLFQDIVHKIPFFKLNPPKKVDKALRYLKYVVLLIMVILLPLFLKDQYGIGTTYFCKYICPAGTLGAGFPLLLVNKPLRMAIGSLFTWKVAVLIVIVLLSLINYRPFCKYLCPLGAMYSFFNRISFYQLEIDKDKCIDCKKCESACQMGVSCTENINSGECIRCQKCRDACPVDAIHLKHTVRKAK